MSEASSDALPVTRFDCLADELISDDQAHQVLGFTRNWWLQESPGVVTDKHSDNVVGRIEQHYIGRATQGAPRDMAAARCVLDAKNPHARVLSEAVKTGHLDTVSIEYETDFDKVARRFSRPRLRGIGLHPNPHNPACRITVRQSKEDPSRFAVSLPLTDARAVDGDPSKTQLTWAVLDTKAPTSPPTQQQHQQPPPFVQSVVNGTLQLGASSPLAFATPGLLASALLSPPATPSMATNTAPVPMDHAPTTPAAAVPPAAAPPASAPPASLATNPAILKEVDERVTAIKAQQEQNNQFAIMKARFDALEKVEADKRRAELMTYKDYFGKMKLNAETPEGKAYIEKLVSDPNMIQQYEHYVGVASELASVYKEVAEAKKTAEAVKAEAEKLRETQIAQGTISEMITKRLKSEYANSPTNPFNLSGVSAPRDPAAELARGQQSVSLTKEAYDAGGYGARTPGSNGFFYGASSQPPLSGNPLPGGPKLATEGNAPAAPPSTAAGNNPAATPPPANCAREAFTSTESIMRMIEPTTRIITAQGAADVMHGGATGTSTLAMYGKQLVQQGTTWNERAAGGLIASDGRFVELPNGRRYDLSEFWLPEPPYKSLPFRPLTDADKMAVANATLGAGCGFQYRTCNLYTAEDRAKFDPMNTGNKKGKKNRREGDE